MSDEENEEMQFDPAVILDNGSGSLKVGMAIDSRPQAVIPNIVGRPNKGRSLLRRNKEEEEPKILLGDEVLEKFGQVEITYPMEHGIVTDWADMQSLWEYAYEEIEEDPSAQPVLMTEAPFNPKKNKEKAAEILFEGMGVPAMQVKMQGICSLYASGRVSGLVLDSGDGVTHAVPVFEGFVVHHAIQRSHIAGREITKMLQRMLFQKGYNFSTHREMLYVQDIKQESCYVAQDYAEELAACEADGSSYEKEHTLPDGQTVTLTDERFKAPEVLFDPTRLDSEEPPLQRLVWDAIQHPAVGIHSRSELLANVILSGGNTLFPGIGSRLHDELMELKGPGQSAVIKVVEDPSRAESVFAGAGVLAMLPSFRNDWLTSDTYDEEGVACVSKYCFS